MDCLILVFEMLLFLIFLLSLHKNSIQPLWVQMAFDVEYILVTEYDLEQRVLS